jgi:two-component system response regulator PilR (NtrC family)
MLGFGTVTALFIDGVSGVLDHSRSPRDGGLRGGGMNVLVVDDEPVVRRSLDRAITRTWRDARIASVGSLPEAERALDDARPDVMTVDLGLPPEPSQLRGLCLVERLAKEGRAHHAVVVTGRRDAVDVARRAGARVVLIKPVGYADLREAGRQLGIPLLGEPDVIEPALSPLVGASRPMRELHEAVRRVAREGGPVLIEGETGTGKELVARAIHGLRGKGPFHPLNCSTLEGLADSQLFGHARGAFTSAERRSRGAIEQAGDGVLFLDEIGELGKSAQAKLLRVLEGNDFQALADERWLHLEARLVSACHADLEACVAEGRFREDLFYRLAVHVIRVPPLRERPDDMPALVDALLRRLTRPKHITADAITALAAQRWPGNVRQLAGFLERVAVHACDDTIDVEDVREVARATLGSSRPVLAGPAKVQLAETGARFDVEMAVHARMLNDRALRETNGNVAAAARLLGVDRMVVTRWMQKQRRR